MRLSRVFGFICVHFVSATGRSAITLPHDSARLCGRELNIRKPNLSRSGPSGRFVGLPYISNNVGPVKPFLSTLLFSLERVFFFRSFRFFFFFESSTKARS